MITNHTADTLRAFEQSIAEEYDRAEIPYPVHLSSGNEQQLISIFEEIGIKDWICCSWRSHLHCLLKGVPLVELRTAIRGGRSISLCFPEHRVISSAIVGGIIPIALGLALAAQRSERRERVWCFVGDMTAMTGAFHEATMYAAGHDLPVHWIVENNGLSVLTPTTEVWPRKDYDEVFMMNIWRYRYQSQWPHAGAGKRINF